MIFIAWPAAWVPANPVCKAMAGASGAGYSAAHLVAVHSGWPAGFGLFLMGCLGLALWEGGQAMQICSTRAVTDDTRGAQWPNWARPRRTNASPARALKLARAHLRQAQQEALGGSRALQPSLVLASSPGRPDVPRWRRQAHYSNSRAPATTGAR